ncbi:MAG: hypothetical protein CMJ84_16130 [Planctomycetes bacterium]|jgi:hypothetical protein|nr:hypothetical protein [Planctomycetota bacterium]
MLTTILLTWALAGAPAPVAGEEIDEQVELLVEEYEQAVDAHRLAIKQAADLAERRVLRKQAPAKGFLPRFEALAEAGGGRAWLWIVVECRRAGVDRKRIGALKDRCFTRLCADHSGAQWFGEALERLRREERAVGSERARELLRGVAAEGASEESRAGALYQLARLELGGEEDEERGHALLDRLIEEFPQTSYAEQAERDLFLSRNLAIGKTPPDFETTDVDGVAFRLSDYRGKIVVIDFWGFW